MGMSGDNCKWFNDGAAKKPTKKEPLKKEPITASKLQLLINYIDEGEPDIEVVKAELGELILRSTGEYFIPNTL